MSLILAANKPVLLKQDLLEKILPFTMSPMSTVVFKLLGTLRMAVDRQSKNFVAILSAFNFFLLSDSSYDRRIRS